MPATNISVPACGGGRIPVSIMFSPTSVDQTRRQPTVAVEVVLPSALRSFTNGQARVGAEGGTVRDVLDDLERKFPGIDARIREQDGSIRRFVNVFVNGEDVRL